MKTQYFSLASNHQREAIEQTAIRLNLPKQAVEKDLWVTAVIQLLFTLPCADSLVFKGGTSLSKAWGLINRFSEDIDLAIDRCIFDFDGELTKRQIKKLRKASSLFVRDELYAQLHEAIGSSPLAELCKIEAQPDGEGDDTYPEPRRITVAYQSLFPDRIGYIAPTIVVEAGARSLLEPSRPVKITSLIESTLPTVETTIANCEVRTAIAEKTFIEKTFLLHELFSAGKAIVANRRSRHLYDLFMMTQQGIDNTAIEDNELWKTIQLHRSVLTSVQGVDYSNDVRGNIQLVPSTDCLLAWKKDYEEMCTAMIYGDKPSFDELIAKIKQLERTLRNVGGSKI